MTSFSNAYLMTLMPRASHPVGTANDDAPVVLTNDRLSLSISALAFKVIDRIDDAVRRSPHVIGGRRQHLERTYDDAHVDFDRRIPAVPAAANDDRPEAAA